MMKQNKSSAVRCLPSLAEIDTQAVNRSRLGFLDYPLTPFGIGSYEHFINKLKTAADKMYEDEIAYRTRTSSNSTNLSQLISNRKVSTSLPRSDSPWLSAMSCANYPIEQGNDAVKIRRVAEDEDLTDLPKINTFCCPYLSSSNSLGKTNGILDFSNVIAHLKELHFVFHGSVAKFTHLSGREELIIIDSSPASSPYETQKDLYLKRLRRPFLTQRTMDLEQKHMELSKDAVDYILKSAFVKTNRYLSAQGHRSCLKDETSCHEFSVCRKCQHLIQFLKTSVVESITLKSHPKSLSFTTRGCTLKANEIQYRLYKKPEYTYNLGGIGLCCASIERAYNFTLLNGFQ